ncbi:MAG: YifB family Mg chelatase-like AAA ATPase [Eggerthellales bacterium]|nr:YifB family Mg chelatase-like AAA ATPase [Eggerthellales bacterium]
MAAQFSLTSATISGVEAKPVEVEVVISRGLPGMTLVGMPDAAVRESLERVRCAMRACGFSVPGDKVVINLSPSSMRKTGSGFDLPIAVALLAASGQIPPYGLQESLWVGELSLEGKVRPVRGTLAYAIAAHAQGLDLVASSSCADSVHLDGLNQRGIGSLRDLLAGPLQPLTMVPGSSEAQDGDFGQIFGQDLAKRALQVAAAGGHGILLMGPPGSGKTMLARALPSILPPLDQGQILETAMVHSVAGEPVSPILQGRPPFQAVHHSATMAGLIGGGTPLRPGAISLAHNGVLFLDELAEFSSKALQSLRQPLEQGQVHLSRAEGNLTMPARFMLVAASNPCPCGYYGDPEKPCTCSASRVVQYRDRIGGPLLDRIDIHVDVWRSNIWDAARQAQDSPITSAKLYEGVRVAKDFSRWRHTRYQDDQDDSLTSLFARCRMSGTTQGMLEGFCKAQSVSGRGLVRILGLARTIADLDQSAVVEDVHMLEAMALRVRKGA